MSKKGLLALTLATPKGSEDVTLASGQVLNLRPVNIMEILALIKRYPTVKGIMMGFFDREPPPEIFKDDTDEAKAAKAEKISAFNREVGKVVIGAMIDEGGNAVAALAAIAAGNKNDKEAEEAFKEFETDDQILVLQTILRITMPDGAMAFFGKLRGLAGGDGMQSQSPATTSETPSQAI